MFTALIAVFAVRKRTGSETNENDATAAGIITQSAVSMIPYFQERMKEYEARLSMAEAATLEAQRTANSNREALNLSREAEHRCLERCDEMQAQINAMQAQIDHPRDTTVVTTQVTTSVPATTEEKS